jgi:peptidyl-prolyl cis-trans isomerase C
VKKLAFVLVVLLFLACPEREADVLVRVDGSTLTKAEFENYIPEAEAQRLSVEQIREFCQNWAEQEIVYLEAKKQGIDEEDSIRAVLEDYEKQLLTMGLVRREFGSTSVSETEVREYFEEHKDEFLYAVRLGQIVLPSYEAAQTTLGEIRAGADFIQLAKERSLTRYEDPDDPRVITDYLPRGMIADYAIEEAIYAMERGEISDVIPYLQGTYLIVKLIDKKKMKATADFEEHKTGIQNYLLSKKYQDFLEAYVDSLKDEYEIKIDLSPLSL